MKYAYLCMTKNLMMEQKERQDIAYFISFCIEQYKTEKGMEGEQVMNLFNRYGVFEYLQEFYDVLHTQSAQWILGDINNRRLDYGTGFYTTTAYWQAERWVQRRMRESKIAKGYVNVYDFNDTALIQLKSLIFEKPTEEWVDFVMQNRTLPDFSHNYDIVYGPVANDHVYAAFALFEGNVISKKTLIEELRTYQLVDQYLFHTERSLDYLKFKEIKEVTLWLETLLNKIST